MWRIARHRTLKKKIKNNACVLCCFESAEYEQAGMRFDAKKRMLPGLDFFFVSLCFPEESVGCCEDTFLQIQKRTKAAEPRTLSSETTSLFGGFGGGGEIPNCERRENLPIVQRIADEIEGKKATSQPFFFLISRAHGEMQNLWNISNIEKQAQRKIVIHSLTRTLTN